jgi:hypothetical protein
VEEVAGNKTIIKVTDLGNTQSMALIIGILLGVAVLACSIGFFVYRSYKAKSEDINIRKI